MDEIAEYGSSRLYGEIAFEIALEQGLLGPRAHLDTTSFSLHGSYEDNSAEQLIEVTHGYSKDHRPDLKQVMMSLTMTGQANLPIWMEPLSGNSSDKVSFHETISRVRRFQKELKACNDFFWVADSALYSADKLLACPDVYWLSRVPENIKECDKLVSLPLQEVTWTKGDNGYEWMEIFSTHVGIRQRWLLVFSQQAYDREKKTLMKRIEKEKIAFSKACWHLSNQLFGCLKDAEKHVAQLHKQYRYHRIGKPIDNPTIKWLFQCMEGVSIIRTATQAMITNLDDLRCKIIELFGGTACQIYGIEENFAGT